MLHKTFSFRIISIYLTQFFKHKIKFENPKLEFHSRVPLKIRFWRGLGLNTLIFQLFKSKESITLEVLLWINEEQRETRKMGNETPEATERMSDVVVMSQGFYCKKNTNPCIRANPWHLHKACSQTSALSHSAAQLSWYPHAQEEERSHPHHPFPGIPLHPPTHSAAYVWESAVLVPALEVKDEGLEDEEKTGLDLYQAVLSLTSSLAWGELLKPQKMPILLGHKQPTARGALNSAPPPDHEARASW